MNIPGFQESFGIPAKSKVMTKTRIRQLAFSETDIVRDKWVCGISVDRFPQFSCSLPTLELSPYIDGPGDYMSHNYLCLE